MSHFLFPSNISNINVANVPKVRSLAGKLSFMAGIVPTLRPFVAEIWAALAQSSSRDALARVVRPGRDARRSRPSHTVWVKQMSHGLAWLLAFFHQSTCRLERAFLVDTQGFENYAIWCDASPWGLGAVLVKTSPAGVQIIEFLSSPLCAYELQRFDLRVGDPAGQALWEGLAVIVAVRAWRSFWSQSSYTRLAVRSDSLAALGAARRLASADPKLNCVMQELALQVAVHGLNIGLISHTPGIANQLPDALSRRHQAPNWKLPPQLPGVTERRVGDRRQSWWIARNGPARST